MAKSASTWSGSVTSTDTKVPPASFAAALPASASMSPQTTFAPSDASLRAVARPMPLPAPVMTAVRPVRRRQMFPESVVMSVQASVPMKTFLVSVKAARASGPSSRPSPDCR